MNKLCCFLIFFLICRICDAQVLDWEWAHSGGGANFEQGNSVCADNSGNIYVTGFFSSPSITFDSITLINTGTWNVFIVKYDSTGTVLWAKSPISNHSEGKGIITDDSGNVYISGYFSGDSIIFDSLTLYNSGDNDIFLTKFNPDGNVIWSRSAGGQRSEQTNSVCTDVDGNILITGYFVSDFLVFDSIILYHHDTINGDIFTVKYDSGGNVLWAESSGGFGNDIGTGITTDQNKNVYVTGTFNSSSFYFAFDTLSDPIYYNDVFVLKYDSAGNEKWAISGASPYLDASNGITTDLSGNVYVTGFFSLPYIIFGSITLNNSQGHDVFLVKVDSAGNYLWAKSSVGPQQAEGYGICTDILGNIYVTRYYEGGPASFDSITLNSNGDPQMFLAKYDFNGNVLWAFSEGGSYSDFSNAICTDINNNIFITGRFWSDPISFGSSTLYPIGAYDMFVANTEGISLGISYQNFEKSIPIFPNPFSNKLNITINNNSLSEIILYDISSRKLLQQKFTNSVSLNTAQLAKGIYIYEVRNNPDGSGGAIKKGKVVKE